MRAPVMTVALLAVLALCAPLASASEEAVPASTATGVDVRLYIEALCPDCVWFYNKCMYPMLNATNIASALAFTVYPFGNGKIVTRDPPTFTCQHGAEECYLNMVETCVDKENPQKNSLDFLYCLESATGKRAAIERCCNASKVDYAKTMACVNGSAGPKYELEVADATPADHKFVPWLTIDGVAVAEDDLPTAAELICAAVKGAKPSDCSTFTCKNMMRRRPRMGSEGLGRKAKGLARRARSAAKLLTKKMHKGIRAL